MDELLIHEVGPRDGLQIEKRIFPTEEKVALVETILESGVDVIQLGSFVNPERVPQMADTEKLFERFRGPRFSALVLNEKGLDRGRAAGVDYFCMGASASDTHSRRNTGMSTEEAVTRIIAMGKRALAEGCVVQVSVQSAFGCSFEGAMRRERVLGIIKRYLDAGLTQVSLADTAGHAQPWQVEGMLHAIRDLSPDVTLACHFHDTFGLALANCYAAIRAGVRSLESAIGGLGGCPFTAQTAGNACTEDLVQMLQSNGMRGDIDLDPLIRATKTMSQLLGRELPGRVHAVESLRVAKSKSLKA